MYIYIYVYNQRTHYSYKLTSQCDKSRALQYINVALSRREVYWIQDIVPR